MNKYENLLKIHICGKINEEIIKNLFPKPCDQEKENQKIGDWQWKTEQFNWIGKIYNENTNTNTFTKIYKVIKDDSESKENKIKKHIILSFGDEENEKLFQELLNIGMVYLPRFIFVTHNEGKYGFNKKMFITNIIDSNSTSEEIVCNIKSEIWEIDCYYNERGNENCKFLPNNIIKNIEVSNLSINLLLVGISRAGKSSFINIVNNSLLALESCEKSSITSKISEYQIFGESKTEKDGVIKIIDTPGFNYETNKKTDEKKIKNLEQINQGILDLINEHKNKNSIDNIHFVLFFFLEGTPLQGTQKVLEMFMKENYPVLFIINKSTNEDDNGQSSDINSTIKFLKEKGLNKLAIPENIICCNIIHSNKCYGYGIEMIFKRIFNILTEKNRFYAENEIFKKIKESKEKINTYLNVEGKENEYKKYLNDSIEIKKKISKTNELFKKYEGEEKILEEGNENAKKEKKNYKLLTVSNAFIPIPYTDLALTPVLQISMVYSICNGYGISLFGLDKAQLKELFFPGGVREIGHLGYNTISKSEFFFSKTAKGCLVELAKLITKKGNKSIIETIKFVPFFGFIVGGTIGSVMNYYSTEKIADNTILFCEKYLREKGSLEFIINRLEIFTNIFKEIKRLSEKKQWWDYKVKVIKNDIN